MKKLKTLYWTLALLPMAACLAALRVLPDSIPAHYAAAGQVTRWGSKYEVLIFPVFIVLFALFMLAMMKVAARQEGGGGNNQRVVLLAGAAGLALQDTLCGFFLYTSFAGVKDLSALALDFYSVEGAVLGAGLILIGNYMPKARRNSMFGFRTAATMRDDDTWKQAQRFAGRVFLVVGGGTLAACLLFLRGFAAMVFALAALLAGTAVCLWYSYRLGRA